MERSELIRTIEQIRDHKRQIAQYLADIKQLVASGQMDRWLAEVKMHERTNGRTPYEWITYYDRLLAEYSAQLPAAGQYDRDSKPINLPLLFAIFVVLATLGYLFTQPSLTGFVIRQGEPVASLTDGYSIEGQKWVDIHGSRSFERCLQVSSNISFTDIEITGKVTQATAGEDLVYALYQGDVANNQPALPLGACAVHDYDSLWKSCTIDDLHAEPGAYWVCASVPEGDYGTTYYTVAYQNGDRGRTAFWTGQNWQKLDHSSYTLKAVFENYA